VAALSGSWAPLVNRDVGYAEMARENWNKAYLTVQEANAVTTAATKVFFGAQKKTSRSLLRRCRLPVPYGWSRGSKLWANRIEEDCLLLILPRREGLVLADFVVKAAYNPGMAAGRL
jgi:hypothetical protein